MSRNGYAHVYRLLKEAREEGTIPWEWIVDETRSLSGVDLGQSRSLCPRRARSYRRDFWNQQPVRVEVGPRRAPFAACCPGARRVCRRLPRDAWVLQRDHVHDVAQDYDGRDLIVLYVGDYDPSGCSCRSTISRPARQVRRLPRQVRRIALTREQTPACRRSLRRIRSKDPRFRWFVRNYGDRCWELDAMDPNDLRALVEEAIS